VYSDSKSYCGISSLDSRIFALHTGKQNPYKQITASRVSMSDYVDVLSADFDQTIKKRRCLKNENES
jgi:hypothetical protein